MPSTKIGVFRYNFITIELESRYLFFEKTLKTKETLTIKFNKKKEQKSVQSENKIKNIIY